MHKNSTINSTRSLEETDLNQLIISDGEIKVVNSIDIKNLVSSYDEITLQEAKTVVGWLGYKNAQVYTKWFSNRDLNKNLYLLFAKKVSEGVVSISELKGSSLELMVQGPIKKFGLTKKQLEQRGYKRINPDTGHPYSAESPYRSSHEYEHEDSRIDRLED